MKNTIKFFAFFALLFSAFSAFGIRANAQTRNEILIVGDQKASCRGVAAPGRLSCFQVKHLNEEKFSLVRQNIAGFDYQAGFYYVIEVRQNRSGYRLQRILAQVRSEDVGSTDPGSNSGNLSGVEWRLTKIDGNLVNNDGKAVIRFDEQNNRASGNGGCNGFGGTLSVDGNNIKVSQIISTKMACVDNGKNRNESQFFRNLERATSYRINGNNLMLMAGGATILEFRAS